MATVFTLEDCVSIFIGPLIALFILAMMSLPALEQRFKKGEGRKSDKHKGGLHILAIYGSVLPRCLPFAVIGSLEGAIMKASDWKLLGHHSDGGGWFHPYSLHVFGMVLGFTLVMRIQISYQRFWEGTTQCHQAASKWGDAVMQVMAFDEASKDAFSEAGFEFRMLIIHFASLMHACALIDIRRDEELGTPLTINRDDPYLFRPCASVQSSVAPDKGEKKGKGGGRDSTTGKGRGGTASHRMHTVPLPLVLRLRRQMKGRMQGGPELDSYEAVDAKEKAEPAAPVRPEASEGPFGGRRAGGTLGNAEATKAGVRKGSLNAMDYINATILMRGTKKVLLRLTHANCFDVVGGASDEELALLTPVSPGDRAYLVQTWMVRLMTSRLAAGGLAIPPPLLSRTYQVLSDGTAAAMQARKVSFIAFPFPLRQLLAVLLAVFQVLAPMCIAAFMDSVALVSILSFFVVLGYFALNETARELEQPFGLGANHLHLTVYQKQFNAKVARLLDRSVPQLGYLDGKSVSGLPIVPKAAPVPAEAARKDVQPASLPAPESAATKAEVDELAT